MRPLVVVNAVGVTPKLLPHMPNLRRLSELGFGASLNPILPAVTCSVQATFLTGRLPRDHGVVGNGWYFRDLGEVFLWRQHNALIQGDKLWDHARRDRADWRVANVCWWYAMGAATDLLVTPRPIYHADGRKSPDCYTRPPELHDELVGDLGAFPLFTYWGPTADITSSRWIVAAARRVLAGHRPDCMLVYVPHLDYDLQRFGPDSPQAVKAAADLDTVLGPLLDDALAADASVVVLSEYGITDAARPVDVNRALRRAGLLDVHVQEGRELLDPWASRAFAVADHQIAHVYVRDPGDLKRVADVCAELPGVAEVMDLDAKARHGLDHERSGELVLLADPDAWFTYYYWLDDDRAPDFARSVDIHRKPGYDPAELFFDPRDPLVKARAATALARKKLGLRYTTQVVPLDPTCVRGSHGRLPDDPADGPVFLCSDPGVGRESIRATEVMGVLLELTGRR
ncbi:alkaline phosphatase family protein [Actinocorallia sp. A-T 12471]|uniref:alkaline phosphatase family protein n=1 Tax=Actinocorallia sp. A-T 12471 TaxID=3089813 RepID=UPI0029D046F7|nr:alkaline phosphatase family protein [Actinocorallia sp. A-T 12471]MDX6740597.1 alkaline phosphatase family protein [Actinocorallia sp. A-T 12471]